MSDEAQSRLYNLVQKILDVDGDLSQINDADLTMCVKIRGSSFDSSITGEVARSLWQLQENLYRVAALIIHGQPNIKKLSAEERKQLTLNFKIEAGCTELLANVKDASTEIAKGFKTMESKDKKCVLIVFIVCCLLGWTVWEVSDAFQAYNKTYADLEQTTAMIEPINNAIQLSSASIAKSSKNADEVTFGPKTFSKADIEKLNSKTRSSASMETEVTTCRVTGVHALDNAILRVDLVNTDTHEAFSAVILPKGVFEEELPSSSAEIGAFIDSRKTIEVTLVIRETRSKIERVIVDWKPTQE